MKVGDGGVPGLKIPDEQGNKMDKKGCREGEIGGCGQLFFPCEKMEKVKKSGKEIETESGNEKRGAHSGDVRNLLMILRKPILVTSSMSISPSRLRIALRFFPSFSVSMRTLLTLPTIRAYFT